MSGFTHFDAQGNAIMVDVTDKDITERCATASGCIRVSREVFDAVKNGTAKLSVRTGVEMEALTGVNVALLTIYDMCKAMDRGMEMGEIHLEEKMGGKSGHFQRTK